MESRHILAPGRAPVSRGFGSKGLSRYGPSVPSSRDRESERILAGIGLVIGIFGAHVAYSVFQPGKRFAQSWMEMLVAGDHLA